MPRIAEVKTVRGDHDANSYLEAGWNLYAALPADASPRFVLVRYEGAAKPADVPKERGKAAHF